MTREIPLTRGLVALVDDEDFDWLNQWTWSVGGGTRGGWYAVRARPRSEATRAPIRMSRALLDCPEGLVVDHIDGDTLNNQRANLRVCTTFQNSQNARRKGGVSGYVGVHFDPQTGRWVPSLVAYGKRYRGPRCVDPAEAARIRDELALQHHGEFAQLNFPPQSQAA